MTDDRDDLLALVKKRYGIIGESKLLNDAVQTLLRVAPTDLTVLITGDTGTGKEVFANALHGLSNRKKFPFVSVNCGAIPETLLESELFGHERGAFTGAHEQRQGFFEFADKGTIFLDEIGEMPFSTQVKLLRVLESGEFSRIGSPKVHKVNVRVIAATNRNLQEEVSKGNFRQDLFFRLNSVHIYLPALKERASDIPVLFEHFATQVSKSSQMEYSGISEDALQVLRSQPWPGNVRELKSFIETMMTLEKKSYVTPDLLRKYIRPVLPPYVAANTESEKSLARIPAADEGFQVELGLIFRTLLQVQNDLAEIKHYLASQKGSLDDLRGEMHDLHMQHAHEVTEVKEGLDDLESLNIEEMEKALIAEALKRYESNRRLAAKELGVSERTLYRKITQYGLE